MRSIFDASVGGTIGAVAERKKFVVGDAFAVECDRGVVWGDNRDVVVFVLRWCEELVGGSILFDGDADDVGWVACAGGIGACDARFDVVWVVLADHELADEDGLGGGDREAVACEDVEPLAGVECDLRIVAIENVWNGAHDGAVDASHDAPQIAFFVAWLEFDGVILFSPSVHGVLLMFDVVGAAGDGFRFGEAGGLDAGKNGDEIVGGDERARRVFVDFGCFEI